MTDAALQAPKTKPAALLDHAVIMHLPLSGDDFGTEDERVRPARLDEHP